MPMPLREETRRTALFTKPTWGFDPELLFVECTRCGRPVIWEEGRSTELLSGAGMDRSLLDDRCMILTDGCFVCAPEMTAYETRVVRVRSLKQQANSLDSAKIGPSGLA